MFRGIYVPLPEPTRKALLDLADREWRRPHEQAAWILTKALQEDGALNAAADNNEAVASPGR